MASLNKVLVIGNLTRDVELRSVGSSGTVLATLGLALNRKWRDEKTGQTKEETTFVDVDVWGKQAETAKQYLSKGKPVFIEGRLKLDEWTDKQSGQKRSKLKVVAERMQLISQPSPVQATAKTQPAARQQPAVETETEPDELPSF